MTYDRASMIDTLRRHGWRSELVFGSHGPVLFIRGDFPGWIETRVPVRLEDDHTAAMDEVYEVIGKYMETHGACGRA